MLGLGRGNRDNDSLPVLVDVVQDAETFAMIVRVWDANSRNVRIGAANNKEFLRFGLVDSKQAVWLERDQGRKDAFELILTWVENGVRFSDVYAVVPAPAGITSGDTSYAKEILNALLTTTATLPVDKQE
jgi:hypothetical protein